MGHKGLGFYLRTELRAAVGILITSSELRRSVVFWVVINISE
jgi:hypothetical protein